MVFSDSSHSQPLPNLTGLKALDELMRCGSEGSKPEGLDQTKKPLRP
jgi:hypothetical protein